MMEGLKNAVAVLESAGHKVETADERMLQYYMENACSSIKNKIHCRTVPKELAHMAVNRALGEFLRYKKTFAPDSIAGLDLSCAVKQIQEGDTNITFAVGQGSLTPEQRLDNFINYLLAAGQDEILHYRRLKW